MHHFILEREMAGWDAWYEPWKYNNVSLWRWAKKCVGLLWCNGQIWPNMVYFSTSFPVRSTHFFHWCLQHLDSYCTEALILILEKVLNCRYDLIGRILLPSQVIFHVGEQKIVRWCHISRILILVSGKVEFKGEGNPDFLVSLC